MNGNSELVKYLKPVVAWIARRLTQKVEPRQKANLLMLHELIKEQIPNEDLSHPTR